MGEFRVVKVEVLKFTYETETTSFKVGGAFKTVKPLSLPMTPVKLLLSACKLQGAADSLLKSLSLDAIKILDD